MKTIRHLITIVFLLCGLTALGSERGYDRNDLVGTYKYNEMPGFNTRLELHLRGDSTFVIFNEVMSGYYGKWEVKENKIFLNFDKREQDPLQGYDQWGQYVVKELEIIGENRLQWGHFEVYGSETGPALYLDRFHNDLVGEYCFEAGEVELSLLEDYTYELLWHQERVAGRWYSDGKNVILKISQLYHPLFNTDRINLRVRKGGRLSFKKPYSRYVATHLLIMR